MDATLNTQPWQSWHYDVLLLFLIIYILILCKIKAPWLSGLIAGLRTKKLQVWFPARAHASVVGQVPCWGHARGNWLIYEHWCFSSSLPSSLPLCLKNKVFKCILKKKKLEPFAHVHIYTDWTYLGPLTYFCK